MVFSATETPSLNEGLFYHCGQCRAQAFLEHSTKVAKCTSAGSASSAAMGCGGFQKAIAAIALVASVLNVYSFDQHVYGPGQAGVGVGAWADIVVGNFSGQCRVAISAAVSSLLLTVGGPNHERLQAATLDSNLHNFVHVIQQHQWLTVNVLGAAQFCEELRAAASAPGVSIASKALFDRSLKSACGTFGSHIPTMFVLGRVPEDLSCLVSPPTPQWGRLHIMPLPAGGAPASAAQAAELINTACNSALQVDGILSPVHALKGQLEAALSAPEPSAAAEAQTDRMQSQCQTPGCWLQGYRDISHAAARCPTVNVSAMAPAEFMRRVLLAHTPVKLVGTGVRHWAATSKWGPEHLNASVGKAAVHVKVAPGGEFEGSEAALPWLCPGLLCPELSGEEGVPPAIRSRMESPHRVVSRPAVADMPVSRLLQLMRGAQALRSGGVSQRQIPSFYVEYLSMSSSLHSLWQDLSMDPGACGALPAGALCRLAAQLHLQHANVWIGDGHTTGKVHFDAFENLLVPIAGAKEVFMWPPYTPLHLYEGHMREAHFRFATPDGGEPDSSDARDWLPTRSPQGLAEATSMVNSPVDVQAPDLHAYPAFRAAIPQVHVCRADAAAGEAIFLPSYWWHEVLSEPKGGSDLDHNLAVNFWYKPLFKRSFPCRDCPWALEMQYAAAIEAAVLGGDTRAVGSAP